MKRSLLILLAYSLFAAWWGEIRIYPISSAIRPPTALLKHVFPGILYCFLVVHTEPIPSESHSLKPQWWISGILILQRSFFEIKVYLHTYYSVVWMELDQWRSHRKFSQILFIAKWLCGKFTGVLSNTLSTIGCTTQMWIFALLSSVMDTAQRIRVQFNSLSTFAWCSTSKTSHDQWEKQKMFWCFFSVFYLILQDLGPSLELLGTRLLSDFLCRALWIDMGKWVIFTPCFMPFILFSVF